MTKRRGKRFSEGSVKEAHQKINFLYQAAHTLLSVNPENTGLARFYTQTMKSISTKLLFKLDTSIKRTICKHCNALLLPGITSTVRVRNKRETHVIITCLECRTVKRYNARKNYELWYEKEKNESPCVANSPLTHTTHSVLNEQQPTSNPTSMNCGNVTNRFKSSTELKE